MPGTDLSIRPSREQSIEAASAWLEALGVLCAGNMSADAAAVKVAAYAPMLAMRYPAGTLDGFALEFVASQPEIKFWPSYALLVETIERWPALYRAPRLEMLPRVSEPAVVISPEEKERVRIGLEKLAKELAFKLSDEKKTAMPAFPNVALKGDALAAIRSNNPPIRRQPA